MIVVDSNVLAYLYLPGEYTAVAEALMEHDPDWAVPVLWRGEFRNILARYTRRGKLTLEHANALQSEAEDMPRGAEYEVDRVALWNWCATADARQYDRFVALAMKLDTTFVTMDGKVLRSFPGIAVALSAG